MVLVACSSSEESSQSRSKNALSTLNAAISNIEQANTHKVDGTMRVQGTVNGEDVDYELTINGQSTFNGDKSQMTIDMSPLFKEIAGTEFIVETRTVDGFVYTKAPNILTGAESWTKVPYEQYISDEEANTKFDSSDFLKHLRSVSSEIEVVGNEEINGQDTTHYKALITKEDLDKYYSSSEAQKVYEDLGITKEQYEQKTSELLNDTEMNIWINDNDQVVRLQVETSASAISGISENAEFTTTLTLNFSNWGEDFSVEVPDDSLIVDPNTFGSDIASQLPEDIRNKIDLEQLQSQLSQVES